MNIDGEKGVIFLFSESDLIVIWAQATNPDQSETKPHAASVSPSAVFAMELSYWGLCGGLFMVPFSAKGTF